MLFRLGCFVSLCLTMFVSGCKPSVESPKASGNEQSITFKLALNSKLLTCLDVQDGVLLQDKWWQLDALKFYVYQLTLTNSENKKVVDFIPSDWQTSGIALLSLEPKLCSDNDESAKKDTATEDTNQAVHFTAVLSVDDADNIGFTLGVPFEENHKNPLTQPSPLNLPLMFWSWQMGHKFMRWDMVNADSHWSFHLGSLGCESASSVRTPSKSCSEPNTVSFELSKPARKSNTIWVHLDRIVEGLDLGTDDSCMFHGNTNNSCTTLMQNLKYNEVFEWR